MAVCSCAGGLIPHPHPFSTISELISVHAHTHIEICDQSQTGAGHAQTGTNRKETIDRIWTRVRQQVLDESINDASSRVTASHKVNLGVYIIISNLLLPSTLELAHCSGVLQALNSCQCFEISPFCGPSSLG